MFSDRRIYQLYFNGQIKLVFPNAGNQHLERVKVMSLRTANQREIIRFGLDK